jgi:uncharacterized protein YjbJ (UPF0337 family)
MNNDTLKGNWKQLKGKAKERWGKLTNDDLDVVEGRADQLAGKIQERYGKSKEEADKEVKEFCSSCSCKA